MITKVWAVINQRARLSRPVIFNCTGAPKCLPRRGLSSASCKELAAAALQTVHRHQPWPGMAVGSHSCCVPTQLGQEPKELRCKPAWAHLCVTQGEEPSQLCAPERDKDKQFSSFPSGTRHGTAQSWHSPGCCCVIPALDWHHRTYLWVTQLMRECCSARHIAVPQQLGPALSCLEAGGACTALFTLQVRQKLDESWAAWSYSLRSHNKPGTLISSVNSWV